MLSVFPGDGPQLPGFKTLLVKGPYHPSAPIHLCLSHTSKAQAKAIILTPSRQAITLALQEFNDEWLATHSACGTITDISSRANIFYPPTPAHLSLLLSLFRISQPSDGPSLDTKTVFDVPPSLIILCEPSAYFMSNGSLDPNSHTWTISSYLSLVAHALASLSFLSASEPGGTPSPPAFALFDSRLDHLKLPVIKPLQFHHHEIDDQEQGPRLEPVSILVQKYFEWMLIFDQDPRPQSSCQERGDLPMEGKSSRNRMRLYHTSSAPDDEIKSWEWIERPGPLRGASERQGTMFIWE